MYGHNLRKVLISVLICAVIVFTGTAALAGPITLKISWCTTLGKTDQYGNTAKAFNKALKEVAPGQFNVQYFPNRQLGDEKETLEGLGFGTIDMGVITNSPISRIALPFQVNDLPFIYASKKQAYKVLDGPAGQELMKILEAKNIIGLGFAEGGYRHMINNVRQVYTPADVEGIKWRVMPNPLYIEMFRALGGNAVPMAWGEVFTAVQQGTIDGLEIPVASIYNGHFEEVTKYLSLTNHTYSALGLLMSKRTYYKKLTPDQQKAVRKAGRKAVVEARRLNTKNAEELIAKLKAKGMQVNNVKDPKAFRAKVRQVYEKFRPTIGSELLDRVLAEVK